MSVTSSRYDDCSDTTATVVLLNHTDGATIGQSDALTIEDRRQLEVDSAIPADLLAEEGIRRLGHVLDLDDLRPSAYFRHPDPEKARRYGDRPPVDCGGILFPIEDAQGRSTWQFKPDHPRKRDGKPVKYESPPGCRLTIYAPRRIRRQLQRADIPLWITEGVKKTLAAVGQGLCCIGLAGVDAWTVRLGELSVVVPELADLPLDGRLVFIAFDSDAMTKESVRGAVERLKRQLESMGARVVVATIPSGPDGAKQGLDDYIAAGGDVQALAGAAIVAALDRARVAPEPVPERGDCRSCAAMAERAATHDAEANLLTSGPVSAQEAAFYRYIIREAPLALAKGGDRVRLYLPKDAKRANVGRSTATRALNKLRTADPSTLPIIVDDAWRGGKQHVDILIPKTIGDDPWTERRAYVALTRARLAEPRKQQGGSPAASAARWGCRHHPDQAVIETINRHFRCAVDDCDESYSPPPEVVRHPGRGDDVQVESGEPGDVVALFDATFVTTVSADRDDHVQLESGGPDPVTDDDVQVEPPSLLRVKAVQLEPSGPEPERCIRHGCSAPCGPGDPLLCVEHRAEASGGAS